MVIPVLLSGGSGTRLWPLSRAHYPKQFLALDGGQTLFQRTLTRLQGIEGLLPPLVVGNNEHRFLVAEQLRQIGVQPQCILLEPQPRNTAPALAAAALAAPTEDALLLALPADHAIRDTGKFRAAVETARRAALDGKLVAFGVVPTAPETGFGYIRADELTSGNAVPVGAFVEKPDAERARDYVQSGHYLWNSGMFVFRADRLLAEMEKHAPAILDAVRRAWKGAHRDLDFIRLEASSFGESPSISIDYAVMENTSEAVVVPLDAGWSDIGSWSSLAGVSGSDAAGNTTTGDVVLEDVAGSYIRAESRLVAGLGLRNQIVVETADADLVADRDRAQEVQVIVARLRESGRREHLFHRRVHRPWGWYEGMVTGERFQVKHICVKPLETLSLQMHYHRAEHWVVVRGTAEVTRGHDVFLLSEDQSSYIPFGTKHRLRNPGHLPLELIEVQTGSYLGEDDIVRYDDAYGRCMERKST